MQLAIDYSRPCKVYNTELAVGYNRLCPWVYNTEQATDYNRLYKVCITELATGNNRLRQWVYNVELA